MRAAIILAAAAAVVGAQAKLGAPTAPQWPKEFEATIVQVDLRRNFTDQYTQDFSVSNNATKNDYSTWRNQTVVVLTLFAQGREYDIENTTCYSRPVNGFMPIPPVNTFQYNGTVTFNGATVQQWVGTNQRFGDLAYLCTNDNNQYPVAFTDYYAGFDTQFKGFTPMTNWPAATFTAPSNCK